MADDRHRSSNISHYFQHQSTAFFQPQFWFVDEGFETARDVIEANDEDLLLVDGLDLDKIHAMKDMMRRELEDADLEEDDDDSTPTQAKPKRIVKEEAPSHSFDVPDDEEETIEELPPTEIPPVS